MAAWAGAADAHPITDRLGQSIKLTGHQLYASVNSQLINCGQSTVAVPPSDWSVFSLAGSSLAFSVATGGVVTLPGLGDSADFVLEAFSRPVPAGRSSWSLFSQLAIAAGDSTSEAFTTADYAAVFGTPVVGQKIFMRLTPVSQYGLTGVISVVSCVVTS